MSVAVRVAVGAGVGVGEVSAATSGSVLFHSPADEESAELDWSGTEDRARPHWMGTVGINSRVLVVSGRGAPSSRQVTL